MTTSTIAWIALAAVLVFWAVGAHNRLVALRNEIVRAFGPLDEQFRLRQQLLRKQAGELTDSGAAQPVDLEALQAALMQADAACAHARVHPGAAGAIASLRLAEEVLASTRQRLTAAAAADPAMAELATRLAAGDASLAFTRESFNAAVGAYNAAVRQFPTWLVAALFRFRPAGLL
jgi:LemA protein